MKKLKGNALMKLATVRPMAKHASETLQSGEDVRIYLKAVRIAPTKTSTETVIKIQAYADEQLTGNKLIGLVEFPEKTSLLAEEVGNILNLEEIDEFLTEVNGDSSLSYRAVLEGFASNGMAIVAFESSQGEKAKEVNQSDIMTYEMAISQCAIQGKDLAERLIYMREQGITPENTPLVFIGTLKKMMPLSVNQIPKPSRLYEHDRTGESLILRMMRNISLNENVILEGQKSVGKNVAWESVGWLLNRPTEMHTFGSKTTKGEVLGTLSTEASKKEFITKENALDLLQGIKTGELSDNALGFLVDTVNSMAPTVALQYGALTRALVTAEEKGTIFVADELNLCNPNTFAQLFNTLLDGHTREYDVPNLGNVPISKNLIIGGTMNTLGFIGTQQQNAATMSRCNVIVIPAPKSIRKLFDGNNYVQQIQSMYTMSVENKTSAESHFEEEEVRKELKTPHKLIYNKVNENLRKVEETKDTVANMYDLFAEGVKAHATSDDAINFRGSERAIRHVLMGQPPREAILECVIGACQNEKDRLTLESYLDDNI